MFIRTKTVETDGKTYQYAQLVESYRNEQGQPRQRLIASLGRLSEIEIENLKVALKAGKEGESVVRALQMDPDVPNLGRALDYLPVAVVLTIAERMGLSAILREVLDQARSSVPISSVILALIAHRLSAPGSKLAAVRWFEHSATPQLLEVGLEQFNNSRLHRALNALDEARAQLQLRVAESFQTETTASGALFMDVTDTWFEGCGPELAQRRKTKEGLYKKKIGIVLTVNKAGQPLRWKVVEGRRHDSQTMSRMALQLQQISWMNELPIVFDRAMGKPAHLEKLMDAGVRFLTMLSSETVAGYGWNDLEVEGLLKIDAAADDDEQAQAAAIHAVQRADFDPLGRRLWVKDLGVRKSRKARPASGLPNKASRRRKQAQRSTRAARAIRLAEELTERKEESGARYRDVAASMGLSWGKGNHLRRLMKLTPEIRALIREGDCDATLDQLEKIGALAPSEQLTAFMPHQINSESPRTEESDDERYGFSGPELRCFLSFDPVVFAAARAKACQRDDEIRSTVDRLNEQIALGSTSAKTAERRLTNLLATYSLRDCYELQTTPHGVSVERRESAWRRKRRTDGMRLFVLHPKLELTAEEALNLYTTKMAVEVDFRIIKSVLHIRPVHHQTDRKVKAHVDICVLALAVERALNAALPSDLSAPMALEELDSVKLVDIAADSRSSSKPMISKATPAQREILTKLDMLELLQPPAR